MKILSKLNTFWKRNQIKVYFLIYLISAVFFFSYYAKEGKKTEQEYNSGKYIEQAVSVHNFELIDCEIIDDLTFKGIGDNSRLLYTGDIDTIYMDVMYSYGLREFKLYYNTTGDGVFTEENTMIPMQYNKYLIYDLPEDTVQIKMPFPYSTMYFNELIINCRNHTNKYNLTASAVFLLAVVPTVVFLAMDFVLSVVISIFKMIYKKNKQ